MPSLDHGIRRRAALILSALALLFALRVAGQWVAFRWAPEFLPPMETWYSGVLPYPLLLPSQLLILAFQIALQSSLWSGRGPLSLRHDAWGRRIRVFAWVYVAVMALRYVLTMSLFPERRWFGPGTIPIVFHFVLATYLLIWSRYLRGQPR